MLHNQLSVQDYTSLSWLVAYFSLRLGPVEVVGLEEIAKLFPQNGSRAGGCVEQGWQVPWPCHTCEIGRVNFSKTFILVFKLPGLI